MNSVKEFMIIFRRTWEEKQCEELLNLLHNGPNYFKEIPSDQKALALSYLLEGHKSLLKFLKIEVSRFTVNKEFRFAIKQGFKFLRFIIVEYADYFQNYIRKVKKMLTVASIMKSETGILKNVYLTYVEFLKTFNKYEIGFEEDCTEFLEKRGLFTVDEKQYLYRILSAIVHYFPNDAGVQQYSEQVRKIVIENFETEFHKRIIDKYSRIPIYLESLTDLVEVMPINQYKHADARLIDKIQKLISECIKVKNIPLLKLLLKLLINQVNNIDELIYKQHRLWYELFSQLTDDDECSELAIGALKVYYQAIAKILLPNDLPEVEELIQSLKTQLLGQLTNDYMCAKKLRLFVNGYSSIAPVIEKYKGSEEVEEMFSTVVTRVIPFVFKENGYQEYYNDLPDYQEALSRILIHIKHISSDQIKILMKISLLLIKRFPELSLNTKASAIDSLNKTFSNVGTHQIQVFHDYVKNVVFDGIVWSCSHCLSIDADLLQELGKLKELPICYKDYIPFWIGILNSNSFTTENELDFIIKEFLNTFIELSNKLNLSIITREDTIFSDVALSKVAKNEDDFRIFLNAVDLYDELFTKIDLKFLEDKFERFLLETIRASYKNPFVSGFHKIITRLFNIGDKEKMSEDLLQILLDYLKNIIKEMNHHPIELQISCVNLILNIPIAFISPLIIQTIPVFKIALKIGLNDYQIANNTINTLENYISFLDNNITNDFLKNILPDLEIYLRSKESLQIYTDAFEKTQKKVHVNEESLERLQRRIALLFGRIDNQLILEFIHKQSLDTGASWDKKDLLEYSLNFPNISFNIYLDKLLPKIIEMALYSSDRKTRVAASESLHSIVAIILGKTIQYLSADSDRFAPLYEILCPALLKLGCDSDDVIKRLYSPLILQMTHWLSSKLMLCSPATIFLITALFDGLSDESNFTLRDFSGICLAEFAKWAIKQSSDQDLAQIPFIIDNIVENIINFALHPSEQRKTAAAIAFNYLWRILAESEEIVDALWLEFLSVFIKSMHGSDDVNISKSIDNVKRVLMVKSRIFCHENNRRRIPAGIEGCGKLVDVLNWLLLQFGSMDKNVRRKAKELIESLAVKAVGFNSSKDLINAFISSKGIDSFNDIILKDLSDKSESYTCDYLKAFVKSLECFNWIIEQELIDKNSLYRHLNAKDGILFNTIDSFIIFINQDTEMNDIHYSKIDDTLKSESLTAIISFMSGIIQADIPEKKNIYDKVFTKNFLILISCAIFEPEIFGFNLQNLELIDKLKIQLERFINLLLNEISNEQLNLLKQELNSRKFDFDNDLNINEKKGLLILRKCNLFDEFNSKELLDKIFFSLKIGENEAASCVELSSNRKTNFECLLAMILYKNSDIMNLMIKDYLTNEDELIQANYSKVPYGEYFFHTFKDVIVNCLIDDLSKLTQILEQLCLENPNIAFFLLEQLTMWVFKNKNYLQNITEEFASKIIKKFNIFVKFASGCENRKKSLTNIYKTVIRITNNPLEVSNERGELYRWILNELIESKDLLKLSELFENFLICLVGEDSNNIVELEVIFNNLKNFINFDVSLENNYLVTKAMECFQVLTKLLPVIKSSVILNVTINFAAGHSKALCTETTSSSLRNYFASIRDETAIKSLQIIYRLFMEKIEETDRFDVLKYFLLPSLNFCSSSVIEAFFTENIREIFQAIWQELSGNMKSWNSILISKIGSYNLLQLMYLTIDLNKIDAANGIFAKTLAEVMNKPVTRVTKSILSQNQRARNAKSMIERQKELMRQFHCALFNCTTTITCLTNERMFYVVLCQENKDSLIWENIVNCFKKFELSQTFKEFPKFKKKLVNIKNVSNTTNSSSIIDYSYMHSYNLAGSTLNEDILAYDFTGLKPLPNPSKSSMSIVLESDDFNEHECMDTICGFLKVLFDRKLHIEVPGTPSILGIFAKTMFNSKKNVQLFTLKIILNNHDLLKQVNKLFIPIVLNALSKLLNEEPLNYIVTDAILLLIDWNFIPNEKEKDIINSIFSNFINKIDTNVSTEYIVKYNLSIVEMMAGLWSDWLDLPKCFQSLLYSSPYRAVQLIRIFLEKNMEKLLIGNDDLNIPTFLSNVFKTSWQKNEDLVLQICQTIGLFLKYSELSNNFKTTKDLMVIEIQGVLSSYQSKNYDRLVKCVHVLVKAYPKLSDVLFIHVSSNYLKVSSRTLAKCMEVFIINLPMIKEEEKEMEIEKQLKLMNFLNTLENKICEKACLQVIDALVLKLSSESLFSLVQLAVPYAEHELLENRELAYNICMKVYQRFAKDPNPPKKLIELSKSVLISGFLDISDELQQKITTFWTQEINLSDSPIERVLEIFDIYSSNVEKDFLPIFTTIILHSLKNSPMYEKKMFEPLDKSCNYETYKIAVSHRVQNLSYKVPLFTSSLSRSFSQRYSLSSLTADDLVSSHNELLVRATGISEFDDFMSETEDQSSGKSMSIIQQLQNDGFVMPEVPSKKRLSQRFLKNYKPFTNDEFTRQKMRLKERNLQADKQRNTVKLSRAYRSGDFPDIEITPESVLKPLEELIKKDHLICKNVAVSIVCSLLNKLKNKQNYRQKYEEVIRKFVEKINSILKKCQEKNLFIYAILEILFYNEDIEFDTDLISSISKSMGFNSLGALLIERNLFSGSKCDQPQSSKSMRLVSSTSEISNEDDQWVQLAQLYMSIDDIDSAQNIFQNHLSGYKSLEIATVAKSNSQWDIAYANYEKAFSTSNKHIKKYCFNEMCDCLARLSDWSQLVNNIHVTYCIDNDLTSFLTSTSLEKKTAAEWFVRGCVYSSLNGNVDTAEIWHRFLKEIQTGLKEPVTAKFFKDNYAEGIAAMCDIKDYEVCRDFINAGLDRIIERWIQLSPLSLPLRAREVVKMQGMSNVHMYQLVVANDNNIQPLIKYWMNNTPSLKDDLLHWDHFSNYRYTFTERLAGKYNPRDNIDVCSQIVCSNLKLKLKIIDVAYQQGNKLAFKKFLENLHDDISKDDKVPLKNRNILYQHYSNIQRLSNDRETEQLLREYINRFSFNFIKYRFIKGKFETDPKSKVKNFAACWNKALDITKKQELSDDVKMTAKHFICDIISYLINNEDKSILISTFNEVKDYLSKNLTDSNEIDVLNNVKFNYLKDCCNYPKFSAQESDKVADSYLKLAKHCYELILKDQKSSFIIKEFVESTLQSIIHGSEEAGNYFPCLLNAKVLEDPEARDIFVSLSGRVATWKFLKWQAQLLHHLTAPLRPVITPIVQKLIKDYPNALIYNLRLMLSVNPTFSNDPTVLNFCEEVLNQSELNCFIEALEFVSQPELFLIHHLNELIVNATNERISVLVDNLMDKIFSESSKKGVLYRIIENYYQQIESLKSLTTVEELKENVNKIKQDLNLKMRNRIDKTQLKAYSPWLSQLNGSNIEVPGQYSGDRKPLPEYHAKIMKIEPRVQVMQSIRKPIKITLIGNDAKNYNFLVKFGEDLRLDERIEQAFRIMNEILQADLECSRRYLSINTYQVISISNSFGLIQWIDNTKTLQDYVYFNLTALQKRENYINSRKDYEDWIKLASPGQNLVVQYKEALMKYDSQSVKTKMNELIDRTNWDFLRKTFLTLSPSLESFISSRKNFILSYATMCIAQWILGIGDRHPENTLINVESGKAIGIDFASAFDGGVNQSVPELVPFRLTNQILGLMKPFDQYDEFKTIMTHVLTALRKERGPLLAYLTVVADENSNWINQRNRMNLQDVNWLPDRKINQISQKLNGSKPSELILNELENKYRDTEYFRRYSTVMKGTDCISKADFAKRTTFKDENLSPEDQVVCLIDLATDLNVLGRLLAGWSPWV